MNSTKEETRKQRFINDIERIARICSEAYDCENCVFKEKYEGCIFEAAPEYWNINEIQKRAFKIKEK